MFDDVEIITPEPVDTLDNESVGRLKLFEQAFVGRTVEVFAALFVEENIFVVNASLTDCDKLPLFVLISA